MCKSRLRENKRFAESHNRCGNDSQLSRAEQSRSVEAQAVGEASVWPLGKLGLLGTDVRLSVPATQGFRQRKLGLGL